MPDGQKAAVLVLQLLAGAALAAPPPTSQAFTASPWSTWLCYWLSPGHPSPDGEFVLAYPAGTTQAAAADECYSRAAGTHPDCQPDTMVNYLGCGDGHVLEGWGKLRQQWSGAPPVTLSWQAPTLLENGGELTNLAGFRIYAAGELLASVPATQTSVTVPRRSCPYTVTAWRQGRNEAGQLIELESQPSNEACPP